MDGREAGMGDGESEQSSSHSAASITAQVEGPKLGKALVQGRPATQTV
jgi:hypothetical protein